MEQRKLIFFFTVLTIAIISSYQYTQPNEKSQVSTAKEEAIYCWILSKNLMPLNSILIR